MLKTSRNGKVWFVAQPDHAQVAGYLAAHWGNEDFSRPGYFANVPDPERLRAAAVMAIALGDLLRTLTASLTPTPRQEQST